MRAIDGGFAFVPNRFWRDGFFSSLEPDELRLYFFFVLAADRRGMSHYHYNAICKHVGLHLDQYLRGREGLIRKDLIATDGTKTQVLSLPPAPVART